MKVNVKRTIDATYEKQRAEEKRKEQEYIDSLSEEDRINYMKRKKQKQRDALKMLGTMMTLAKSGPYGDFI